MNCRQAAERRLRQVWSVMTSLVEPDQLEPEPGKAPGHLIAPRRCGGIIDWRSGMLMSSRRYQWLIVPARTPVHGGTGRRYE
jgi:hypothetical protein